MDSIYKIDFAILDALQKIHCGFLNVLLGAFSYVGESGAIWIIAALVMLFIKQHRHMGSAVLVSLTMEYIISEQIIKKLVARPRPFTLRPYIDTIIHQPSSYSFPSGHTCCAFAAATAIFCHNKRLGIIAYIVAVFIGFSRNYFYIHYPTDVLCGALEGVLLGLAGAYLNGKLYERTRKGNS